jgi:hypothetical protein
MHGPVFHIVNYNHQNASGVSVIELSVFVDSPGEITEDSEAAWSIVEGPHERLICSPAPPPSCSVPINSSFVFFFNQLSNVLYKLVYFLFSHGLLHYIRSTEYVKEGKEKCSTAILINEKLIIIIIIIIIHIWWAK